jgi:tetratricopeptide (TPR) repeat protein
MSGEDSNSAPKAAMLPTGESARTLSRALAELAELEYRLGDWPAAYLSAVESLRAAKFAGLDEETMSGLVRLALVEAGLGRADACRRHATQAIELSRRRGSEAVEANACEAVGFLELGLDRIDAAIERLNQVALICAEHPSAWTSAVTWAQDLVDACLRRGDRVGAQRAVAKLEERASESGSCVLASALERSRAMLAADDSFEETFQRALRWAARARQPFEQARTELCFGERLSLAGRRQQARESLAGALHTFQALDSQPWADRARQDLAALGEGARKPASWAVAPAPGSPQVAAQMPRPNLRSAIRIMDPPRRGSSRPESSSARGGLVRPGTARQQACRAPAAGLGWLCRLASH